MKLTHNSENKGLDTLIRLCSPRDRPDYGYKEVVQYLVFMDNLDISVAEDMLMSE